MANFTVAVLAAIFAGAALWWVWPRHAMPVVVDIRLYGEGSNTSNFGFLCRFIVRNDGDLPCELEKFEILLENTSIQYARSVRQGELYGPPPPMVASSALPIYIGKNAQQEVVIIGKVINSNSNSSDLPKEIPVKLTFVANGKKIIAIKKVMITQDCLSNMSF